MSLSKQIKLISYLKARAAEIACRALAENGNPPPESTFRTRSSPIDARDFRGRTVYRMAEGSKQSDTRLGIPGAVQERSRDVPSPSPPAPLDLMPADRPCSRARFTPRRPQHGPGIASQNRTRQRVGK